MMNDFIKEAVLICETILDTTNPTYDWGVINLVKAGDSNKNARTFLSNEHPRISLSYYYSYSEIPEFLLKQGVFVQSCEEACWSIGKGFYVSSQYDPTRWADREQIIDDLTIGATAKGWINKTFDRTTAHEKLFTTPDLEIEVILKNGTYVPQFHDIDTGQYSDFEWEPTGPSNRIHEVMLFDRKKMEYFVKQRQHLSPSFEETTGTFQFQGQSIVFTGKKTVSALKILIENINKRVSQEEFYKSGGDDNYKQLVATKRLTQTGDTLRKRFDAIKEKLHKNPQLKKSIIMVSEGGYGMFIDQSHSVALENGS